MKWRIRCLVIVCVVAMLIAYLSPVAYSDSTGRLVSNVLTMSMECYGEPEPEPEGPVLPTVSTLSTTVTDEVSSTLQGSLGDDGEDACSVRFQCGTTTSYDFVTPWIEGVESGDSFSVVVEDLLPGTTHHFRAQARNSVGTADGADRTFVTLCYEPVDFVAVSGAGQISLSWSMGAGANRVVVRGSTVDYPSSPTDGDPVYFGPDATFVHTSLVGGTTYYYAAWSESEGVHSVISTTAAAIPTVPVVPPKPRNWWPIILGLLGVVACIALYYIFWHKRSRDEVPPRMPVADKPPPEGPEETEGKPGTGSEEESREEPKTEEGSEGLLESEEEEAVEGEEDAAVEEAETSEEQTPLSCPLCYSSIIGDELIEGKHICMSCGEKF